MKTTVANIINCQAALQELSNAELKFGTSYKIQKIIKACSDVGSQFDESRKALLNKNAVLNEEDNTYSFPDKDSSKVAAFNTGIQEIVNVEIDLDIPTICVDEFDGLADFVIKPSTLAALEFLLVES